MIGINVVGLLAHVSPHGNVQPHCDEVTGIVRARRSWE